MKIKTAYGLICNKKDEKLIIGRLNDFLAQYHRIFAKSKSLVRDYLPFKYKHIYFNLNKDTGTYMWLTPNEDIEGKYRCQNKTDVGWILEIVISKEFPGYEKDKTEIYISNVLDVIGIELVKLFESDNIEDETTFLS